MLWPRMLASLAAAELAARHQGTSPPFTVSFRAFEGDMAEVTTVKRQWCFFFFAALWNDIFILLHYHRDHFLDHFSSFDLSGRSFILLSYHMRRSGDNGRTLRVAAGSAARPASGHPRRLVISRWYWTCNLSNICRLVLMSVTCFTYHFEEFGVFLCESVASRTILKSSMCCQANVRTSDVFSDALGFSHVSPQRHHFALKGASFECY